MTDRMNRQDTGWLVIVDAQDTTYQSVNIKTRTPQHIKHKLDLHQQNACDMSSYLLETIQFTILFGNKGKLLYYSDHLGHGHSYCEAIVYLILTQYIRPNCYFRLCHVHPPSKFITCLSESIIKKRLWLPHKHGHTKQRAFFPVQELTYLSGLLPPLRHPFYDERATYRWTPCCEDK